MSCMEVILFNDTATTEIYTYLHTLSLHCSLPISASGITADGWPIATGGKAAWLTHCYGMVGVARDVSPDTGTGAEWFTPIGQSARRLDRKYTVVGRNLEGMHFLSAPPRRGARVGF